MTYNCTKNTPPTIANFTELANALTNEPITGPITHYNDVSITFACNTTKQDHASFFSKVVKQTNYSMLIFV